MSVFIKKLHWSNVRDRAGVTDKIRVELGALSPRRDNETPEMGCSRIRGERLLKSIRITFLRMIIFGCMQSTMKMRTSARSHIYIPTTYIYCTVCDSLVFLSERLRQDTADINLEKCIAGNTESEQREDLLLAITRLEEAIWQQKRNILLYDEIKRIQLEIHHNSNLSHSEKDKLASIIYDYNNMRYDYYRSTKAQEIRPKQYDYASVSGLAEAYFDSVRESANL
ncbi:hypothetical protein RclHR1_02670009 [Rhizophagus clarus]|uniref:Uncharacterized protein n=1 Tax=Rhizophagus clarus TaxID=94130 RepID=A0A2Z6R1E7_9GLOM|nr:hypothetical protein RclHR1_02670009 [Rhizophagus clarus]GES82569.1 hypothetical protein GLOIN_2v1707112 [Rhizophagus clarus]